MRHWRKMIILAALAMLAFGAIAYAHGGWGWGGGPMTGMGGYGHMMNPAVRGGQGFGGCGGSVLRGQAGPGVWQAAPREIRDRMKALQRAQLELRLALTGDPVDAQKATELHEKVLRLHEELARWHFERNLEGARGEKAGG